MSKLGFVVAAWFVLALTVSAGEIQNQPLQVVNEDRPVILSRVTAQLEQIDISPNNPRNVTALWVARVTKGSTAEKIGLRAGMRVVAINGVKPVGQTIEFFSRQVAANYRPDLTITVKTFFGQPRDIVFPPPQQESLAAR